MPQILWGRAQDKPGCLFTDRRTPSLSFQQAWRREPESRILTALATLSPSKGQAWKNLDKYAHKASFACTPVMAKRPPFGKSTSRNRTKGHGPICGRGAIQTVGLLARLCWRFQSLVPIVLPMETALLRLQFSPANTTYGRLSWSLRPHLEFNHRLYRHLQLTHRLRRNRSFNLPVDAATGSRRLFAPHFTSRGRGVMFREATCCLREAS